MIFLLEIEGVLRRCQVVEPEDCLTLTTIKGIEMAQTDDNARSLIADLRKNVAKLIVKSGQYRIAE